MPEASAACATMICATRPAHRLHRLIGCEERPTEPSLRCFVGGRGGEANGAVARLRGPAVSTGHKYPQVARALAKFLTALGRSSAGKPAKQLAAGFGRSGFCLCRTAGAAKVCRRVTRLH